MFGEDPVENPYAGLDQEPASPGGISGGGFYAVDPYYPNPYD